MCFQTALSSLFVVIPALIIVIPAKAGIQGICEMIPRLWIPAFAGMTIEGT
jgi:hypothetical protein